MPLPLQGACATDAVPVETPANACSRRNLLRLGALASAFLASREPAHAQESDDPTEFWVTPQLRLARRITMGLSSDEVARATSLSYEDYLEYHLNLPEEADADVEAFVRTSYPALSMEPPELFNLLRRDVVDQLVEATLYRSVYSPRQLFQRMCEFWTDHFNVNADQDGSGGVKAVDDREVIRANALGSFPDMLWASAHSPAMLFYLDNTNSQKSNPNQNYARELLELHTLGADNGYSQQDVIEVARCFTGWGWYTSGENRGRFLFNPSGHDDGEKIVLGETIPANGGQADAEHVLEILASHPNTAGYIALKMARWMLGYQPDPTVVQATADAYLATGGDIKAMLRVILQQDNVMRSPAKYKRPYHLLVSALRAVNPAFSRMAGVRDLSRVSGQPPLVWATPDGYPDNLTWWVGYIIARWNFVFALTNNNIAGVSVDAGPYVGLSAAEIADAIDSSYYGAEMAPVEKSALVRYLQPDPPSETRILDALALAAAAPGFQWY